MSNRINPVDERAYIAEAARRIGNRSNWNGGHCYRDAAGSLIGTANCNGLLGALTRARDSINSTQRARPGRGTNGRRARRVLNVRQC